MADDFVPRTMPNSKTVAVACDDIAFHSPRLPRLRLAWPILATHLAANETAPSTFKQGLPVWSPRNGRSNAKKSTWKIIATRFRPRICRSLNVLIAIDFLMDTLCKTRPESLHFLGFFLQKKTTRSGVPHWMVPGFFFGLKKKKYFYRVFGAVARFTVASRRRFEATVIGRPPVDAAPKTR